MIKESMFAFASVLYLQWRMRVKFLILLLNWHKSCQAYSWQNYFRIEAEVREWYSVEFAWAYCQDPLQKSLSICGVMSQTTTEWSYNNKELVQWFKLSMVWLKIHVCLNMPVMGNKFSKTLNYIQNHVLAYWSEFLNPWKQKRRTLLHQEKEQEITWSEWLSQCWGRRVFSHGWRSIKLIE